MLEIESDVLSLNCARELRSLSLRQREIWLLHVWSSEIFCVYCEDHNTCFVDDRILDLTLFSSFIEEETTENYSIDLAIMRY